MDRRRDSREQFRSLYVEANSAAVRMSGMGWSGAGPLGVWYDVYVFKVGAPGTRLVAAVYQDVTLRKQADAT